MWFFSVPASECGGRTSGQGIIVLPSSMVS